MLGEGVAWEATSGIGGEVAGCSWKGAGGLWLEGSWCWILRLE